MPESSSLHLAPLRRGRRAVLAALVAAAGAALAVTRPSFAEPAPRLPAPAQDLAPPSANDATVQSAVFAGGCFWGVQAVFQHVRGVRKVASGYAGGEAATASYPRVSGGATGHAESVRIEYDPREVSYGQLLQIHFSVAHDPTQLNRQGPDRGTQYRSALFPADAEQARVARAYIAQLGQAKVFAAPIVTTIEALKRFYPAEAEHQDFLLRNPRHPYIVIHDQPKIVQLKAAFPERWEDTAVRTLPAGADPDRVSAAR